MWLYEILILKLLVGKGLSLYIKSESFTSDILYSETPRLRKPYKKDN